MRAREGPREDAREGARVGARESAKRVDVRVPPFEDDVDQIWRGAFGRRQRTGDGCGQSRAAGALQAVRWERPS